MQKIASRIRTPFSSNTKDSTPVKEQPSTNLQEVPSTPKQDRPSKKPRWIQYKDMDKHSEVYEPPRRSERLRLMMKSIPGYEKY